MAKLTMQRESRGDVCITETSPRSLALFWNHDIQATDTASSCATNLLGRRGNDRYYGTAVPMYCRYLRHTSRRSRCVVSQPALRRRRTPPIIPNPCLGAKGHTPGGTARAAPYWFTFSFLSFFFVVVVFCHVHISI